MLLFQLLVYPRIVARIGARTPQRWACCVAIPVFLAYPFLCRLHDDSEGVLMAATVVLLFFTNAGSNTVGPTVSSIQHLSRTFLMLGDADVRFLPYRLLKTKTMYQVVHQFTLSQVNY